jgi:predicted nuclease of restriction endonuclease-like (RecB) superfamily
MKRKKQPIEKPPLIYDRIRQILESAKKNVARSVNTTQVMANWLIGREIVEEEQRGKQRAEYGERLLAELAQKFQADSIPGYSAQNLRYMRQFYLVYPNLVDIVPIRHALRGKSASLMVPVEPHGESWTPGQLHPNLSWTHYRTLLRVNRSDARAFYEIEAIKNNWSARGLERQINSLLFERLALSKDKEGLMRLATKGQEVQQPADVFKDPMVIEFLGLPESPRLVESDLEQALINNLQQFLLELGKGFAFVARQQRLTLDGDHFYIDLVFYHIILKCYVLIDLKTGKLTHQDLGQLQLYVNYYDHECRTEGDNPTLGLILCTDKNDAMVKYTLGPDQQHKIFTSRYKLHLPTEAELKAELQREMRAFGTGPNLGDDQ